MSIELKDIHADLQKATGALREQNETALAEVAKAGEIAAETKQAQDRIDARIDELETKLERKARHNGGGNDDEQEPNAQKAAFLQWVKGGESSLNPEQAKQLSMGTGTEGGYLIPTQVRNQIIEAVYEQSPIRQLASVETISKGSTLDVPRENGQLTVGWVAETAARPETATMAFAKDTITVEEWYANPYVTQRMIDDAAFDVEAYLTRKIAERAARLEGAAFISGTGSGQPEGLLTDSNVATGVTAASTTAITYDELIELEFSLSDAYLPNAVFLLNKTTLKGIRKLKDSDGQYIWSAGTEAGAPATINGYRYVRCTDMPVPAAAAKSVLFGDIKEAYLIVDHASISTLRDPYSAKPYVSLYTTGRVGGAVVQAAAVKKLVMAAS